MDQEGPRGAAAPTCDSGPEQPLTGKDAAPGTVGRSGTAR